MAVDLRYAVGRARTVRLVWGIDGWKVPPPALRPSGTVIIGGLARSRMVWRDGEFGLRLTVPAGTVLDYCWQILQTSDYVAVDVWDTNVRPSRDWHTVAVADTMVRIVADPGVEQALTLARGARLARHGAFLPWVLVGFAVFLVATAVRLRRESSWPARWHWLWRAEQGRRWSLLAVLLVALAARVAFARQSNLSDLDDPTILTGDEPEYDQLARGVLEGKGLPAPNRPPGYPLWLAGVRAFFGGSYHAVRLAQALLGVLTVWLTYVLGRRVFGHGVGLLAAGSAAVSYVLIGHAVRFLTEALFTPLVVAATILWWNAFTRPSIGRFLIAGIAFGLCDLVRPTLLFFPAMAAIVLVLAFPLRSALRFGAAFAIAAVLTITPMVVRDRLVTGSWIPLGTSHAVLWLGSPEYYHLVHDRGLGYLQVWEDVLERPQADGKIHDNTTLEGDRYWTGRAVRSIRAEPVLYARFSAEKAATYWLGDPLSDWNGERILSYRALRRAGWTPLGAIGVWLARVLPLLAMGAVAVLWRDRRRLTPIYSILLFCTALHALTAAVARLSEPLEPLLLVLVFGAVVSLARRIPAPDRSGDAPSLAPAPGSAH